MSTGKKEVFGEFNPLNEFNHNIQFKATDLGGDTNSGKSTGIPQSRLSNVKQRTQSERNGGGASSFIYSVYDKPPSRCMSGKSR